VTSAAQATGGLRYACRVIPFPPTRRSVIERIRADDAEVRRTAFGDLAAGYWRPSYHYLRLHWRLPPEAAEDAVQAFFAVAFEKRYVERYDPSKARFRTFLRTCLDRFVQNTQKAERAEKRGGGADRLSLDFPGAEQALAELASSDLRDLDRFFRDEMIRALFGRAVDDLRRLCEESGKAVIFEVFERHDLAPSPDVSYAGVAHDLGLSVSQVTNYLHAARRRFRELALGHLQGLCGTAEEFRLEARELFGVEVDR
jgi:DNA-directed RNA polymerase specialized sigma24 family protein